METNTDILERLFPSAQVEESELVQELWSGYGTVKRYHLTGAPIPTVIVKDVLVPESVSHPRGWSTDRSHQRKLRSYAIEVEWYARYSKRCGESCRVPKVYSAECGPSGAQVQLVLEDLDQAGFSGRHRSLGVSTMKRCLAWLASFHATFLEADTHGLWPVGTYWHLDTRPDELEALEDARLKQAAPLIDGKLSRARFKTLVHGDAKPANFCFSEANEDVAAVDFQYVGGGVGVKDVAYFIGSCLRDHEYEQHEEELLEYYLTVLKAKTATTRPNLDCTSLSEEWRGLYRYARADFHRFLKGWSPGHWKLSDYSERVTESVLNELL